MAAQKKTKNRVSRLKRALNRRGTANEPKNGWAKKQASRRFNSRNSAARRNKNRSHGYQR